MVATNSNHLQKYDLFYLIGIIAIAALLRMLYLGSIPNGFMCDEASNAYDAYSILETGRDRYGEFLPIWLKAFGNDYRESLYVFITVPFLKIFGLNEFGARFPSALIGTITVVILYYLAKELFAQKVALFAALFLAISPWHIHFSRVAFRAILLPCLFCLGLLFFVRSFKNPKYLPVSSFTFGLSLWTYSSARVFVLLFLFGITLFFWRHLWQHKKYTLIALVLFSLIFIPLLMFWLSPAGMTRAKAVGIETNPINILKNYLSYFSPSFLFFHGQPDLNRSPANIGQLYYFELFTVFAGIISFIKIPRRNQFILGLWLILYPFPAALTTSSSALRSFVGAPILAIFSAYGIIQLMNLFRVRKKYVSLVIASLILLASLTIFGKQYFINYAKSVTADWQYGVREAINYAEKSSYTCIVLSSDRDNKCFAIYDFSVFVPFYTQYSPTEYQKEPIPPWVKASRNNTYSLGKYSLVPISKQINLNEKCLYILRPDEVETLIAKNYQWKEIHSIKDDLDIEHFKLVEVTK